MLRKFVKDRGHNRYPAYCCEDLDPRLAAIEEALKALVAKTVPDGAVTLPKMADDALTYIREINKGRLISEWIGTRAEYDEHIEEHLGVPLPNVRYTITDDGEPVNLTSLDFPVGSIVTVRNTSGNMIGAKKNLYMPYDKVLGTPSGYALLEAGTSSSYRYEQLAGKWLCCGQAGKELDGSVNCFYMIFQRVE